MRRHLIIALAGLSGTLAAGAPATPASAKPASAASNFERTKTQITELLGLRLKPSPLPAVLPNPFSVAAAPATNTGPAAPIAPTIPVDLLTRLAQALKIGGVIQVGGTPSLIINSNPYRQGAWVPIREGETVHRLRIKQITATHVTFEMEGEETTIPIR